MAVVVDDTNELPMHWYHGKDGWYTLTIQRNIDDANKWVNYYKQIVQWIVDNIDGPFKHAGWSIRPTHAEFKFRHEVAYMMFVLRWS